MAVAIHSVSSFLFQSIEIETVEACTRQCWFCKFGLIRSSGTSPLMKWELIEWILENLSRLKFCGRLSWYKTNEPLLDRRMPDIIRLSRSRLPRAFLSLVTNGDLLTPEKADLLYDCGVDVLGVSVYDEDALTRAISLGDERLVVLDRRPHLEQHFVDNRGGAIDLSARFPGAEERGAMLGNCHRPSTLMTVQVDGAVSLCCSDMFGDVRMGTLPDNALEDVWNGERYEHYRRELRWNGRAELALCRSCTYDGQPSPVRWPEGFGAEAVRV